ncbi:MAG: hypothetical protein OEL57_04390 [Trichlorobacter sp.]|uniref:hypothetical protein n=1 Tax=Trichlorobacter sp. TaxID=2911007 RepID=UPI002561ED95|nr:hypothetical protein [Trichlorobacter sp.]MDK9717133.1 hypothetical protein [Trichlorobacter sp.]
MHPSDAVKLLFGEATDLRRVTAAEVKSAFRRRVRAFHPDSSQSVAQHCGEAVSSLVSARDALIAHLESAQKKSAGPAQAKPSNPFAGYSRPTIVKPVRPVVEKLSKKEHERYYTGVFPTYKLKFGQFLYFATEISWQDLVRGMRWQRDQRPPYGEIAKAWGWLTDKDIQIVRAATDIPGVFGEKAVSLGMLTPKQAAFLVRHQHHSQPRLGEYFVKERILLPHEVNQHLKAMQRHNTSIDRGTGPVPPFHPAGYVR